jgi:uncharacterized protein (TIGR04222 family)
MGESHVLDVLTLRGPEFLVFYFVVAVLVVQLANWVISAAERGPPAAKGVRDPYLIAYLRDGQAELVRVASLSLALRGLLRVTPDGLVTADLTEIDRATVPLEKAVLSTCRKPVPLTVIARDARVDLASREYYRTLAELGLYADARIISIRRRVVTVAMVLLVALAVAKIGVALAAGHSNVGVLIILAAITVVILRDKLRAQRTRRGTSVLRNLNVLFGSLKKRSKTLGANAVPEATLLAAVFGVYVASGLEPNLWRKVFPESTVGSGGGSSCGSSGCGGGCGGGGCGGCGS